MSWEEIYDNPQSKSFIVDKNSVILNTRHRKMRNKIIHYLFNIILGVEVLKQLQWTKDTKLKFQWGKDENLGKVRISCVLNESIGWQPQITKSGYARIQNKALPKNINEIERNIELVYSIERDERQDNLFFLELFLPQDFYLNNTQTILTGNTTLVNSTSETSTTKLIPTLKTTEIIEFTQTVKSSPVTITDTPTTDLSKKVTSKTPSSTKNINVSKPATNNEVKSVSTAAYDFAIVNGGPLTPQELCRFVRIFIGDDVYPIEKSSNVKFNDKIKTIAEILDYANKYRTERGKPIFNLTN